MKTLARLPAIALCGLMLVACGDDSSSASGDADPCALLSNSLLDAHFPVPDPGQVNRSPSRYSPHPLCMVTWEKANAAELQAEYDEEMTAYMKRKMQGEKVDLPAMRTRNEVTLTLYTPLFDSEQAAQSGFNSAMRMLQAGTRSQVADTQINFQADLETVSGVGDEARWAARLNQLSIVDGRRILHITVDTGADKARHLALAKALAQDLLPQL